MATQALYRAWRPLRFADVAGQEPIVTTLQNQIASGRIAHAYLFCGSRGTGKTTMAKIFARAVNCETPENGEPCGVCTACVALSAENCLDIVEIDAASNNGVDEIRDLREKVKYPPQSGRYRVYIIDEVHMLSTGAFNALLKTLEEPPAHALFILATTEPQKLPATVLSRCQRFDFRRFTIQVLVDRMRTVIAGEHAQVEDEALSLIAHAAEGGMRDALSLLDMCLSYGGGSVDAALVREVLGAADRGFLFDFAASLLAGDAAAAVRGIDAMMRSGREPQVFARDLTWHLRGLLLAQTCGDTLAELLEITPEDAGRFARQAAQTSRERLLRLLDLFLEVENNMKWSGQSRIVLEAAAVRACLPEDTLRLDGIAERVDMLEKKLESGAVAVKAESRPPQNEPAKRNTPPTKPTPSAAPIMTNTSDLWNGAMQKIKKEPYLYAPLMQGRFAGMDGDAAHVLFQKGGEIYINMLKQADRQQKVEAALSEAAGRAITLNLEMEPDAPENTKKRQNTLQTVFDTFGRENVQVIDE